MKKIKLNLGAGFDHRDGWINADVDSTTNPDQIIDLTKPLPFKDSSVNEVLLQDVLEHFIKKDAQKLLTEIARVLKPNGLLTLRVPNPVQIINQFSDDPEVMMEFLYGTTDYNGIWGAHKYGYSQEIITKMLKMAGFDQIDITEQTTNFQIHAHKSTMSLPKPNILIIQQSPDWGGAEEWMSSIINQWVKEGIQVTGVTNFPKMERIWQDAGSTTIHLPFILDIIGNLRGLIKAIILFPYAVWWYSKLVLQQQKKGVNVVVMSGFSEKMLVSWIAKLIGLPIIWFEYGPLGPVFKKNLYLPKIIYRLTKHIPQSVITISDATKQSLINDARVSLSKIALIPPGVTIPKKLNNQKSKDPVIGHLSRLAPEKGQRLILSAFKLVLNKFPRAQLRIAGQGPDKAHLHTLTQELQIEDKVEFLGFIKDKSKFYQSLSLFVFAGIWNMEGFGMVMAEALSHGVPVVAVDNGPAKEIINQKVGMLVQPTPQSIAQGIIQILVNKNQFVPNKAYNYAKTSYNATIQVAKITQYVQQAIILNRR